ncbi:FlaD/FlaE family flagellar protein [Haloarchaeobius salinus]|uniref:FlaD/FlaE family flagellar protein n=1 Tax=Haloarchaeobius salinus TaxID=1198298 RepID=UPI00210DF592|nr:FlaD/FlaE family flagellar protein [Haloarchaeobius salinus]
MGLRDVLADFLSSEGPQGGSESEADDEEDEAETSPDPSFDVPLEDLDQEEQIENLEHRIDSMQEDIERSSSQIESIQSSQEEVADRVEDVNGTVRQLLGIYDQLTASANPFVEGGSRTRMDDDVEGFGLGGEPEPEDATGEMPPAEAVENEAEPAADEDGDPEPEELADNEVVVEATDPGDEDAVSFDDLKAGNESSDDEREQGDDGQQAVQTQREQEDDNTDDTRLEVEPLSDEAAQMSDAAEGSRTYDRASRESRAGTREARSDATLPSLADTYATDILVFEWLTDLVTSAGPAAALRAIAYYEEIGWISPEVKAYLEDTLSGPDLDMTVDPSRDPNELNAEDHAESYEYIMKLDAIQQTMDDTGL